MRLTFWIPGEPLSKGRPRVSVNGTYTPKPTRLASERATLYMRQAMAGKPPLTGLLRVSMHFFRGSHAKRDLDNMAKLILDAGEGVVYVNDVQVATLDLSEEFVPTRKDPVGALVLVEETSGYVRPPWVTTLPSARLTEAINRAS